MLRLAAPTPFFPNLLTASHSSPAVVTYPMIVTPPHSLPAVVTYPMIVVKSRMQAASKAASSNQPQQYNGTLGAISRIMHVRPTSRQLLCAAALCCPPGSKPTGS